LEQEQVPGGERLFRREERKTPIESYVNPFAVGFLTAHRFKVDNWLAALLSSLLNL
jgi:hypothetical protein